MFLKPQFQELSAYNNTTGHDPLHYEVVLIIPWNTQILQRDDPTITLKILEAPGQATVAGYQYKNIRVPDYDLYSKSFTLTDLTAYTFKPIDYTITNNKIQYRSRHSNIETEIDYDPNCTYYDLSSIELEVDGLPDGVYFAEWCIEYPTITSDVDIDGTPQLICIDAESTSRDAVREIIEHPGAVLSTMLNSTPGVYYTSNLKNFYRPFAEVLNDFKKQGNLITSLNLIDFMPKYYIQYLAYMIGWDLLPIYSSDDKLKRALIKSAWKLKQYKGSYQAITELLNIFGYLIDITKLHYSTNRAGLLNVTKTESIKREILYQSSFPGFKQIDVPLLNQPKKYITIIGYKFDENQTYTPPTTGFITNYTTINNSITDNYSPSGYDSKHIATINLDTGEVTNETYSSTKIFNFIEYDRFRNIIYINSDHYYKQDQIIWYGLYKTDKETLPNQDYRSNKFDVKISTKDESQIDTVVLDYLIKYIIKLKPFHSILRKVMIDIFVSDAYLVTDLCTGDYLNEPNTDFGEMQIAPAVIPENDPCGDLTRGFKNADVTLRNKLLELLREERAVRNTEVDNHPIDSSLQPYSLIPFQTQTKDTDSCFDGRVSEATDTNVGAPLGEAYYNAHCEYYYGGGSYDFNWIQNPINDLVTIDTIHTYGYSLHRFATYGKLLSDYTSSYESRPYDNEDKCTHPEYTKTIFYTELPNNSDVITPAVIEALTKNESLSFEDGYFQADGNGLIPDIISYLEHIDPAAYLIFHTPYTTVEQKPYDIDESGNYESIYTPTECISPPMPLFPTYNPFAGNTDCLDECGTNPSGCEGADYTDGYPAEEGGFSYETTFTQTTTGATINDLPWPATNEPIDLSFTYKSQIYHMGSPPGLRYDCGCYAYGMESCSQPFEDEDLEINQKIKLNEEEHCSLQYDGTITYGEIDILGKATLNAFGNYELFDQFVDDYGNITEIAFETDLFSYDLTVTWYNKYFKTEGYKSGYHVYRKGIKEIFRWNYRNNGNKWVKEDRYITTAGGGTIDILCSNSNIYHKIPDIELQAVGSSSENVYIEDKRYKNKIIPHKYNNFVTEDIEIEISSPTEITNPSNPSSG